MKIKFSPYARRDGSAMLYVNGSNGVSVGLSPERGFAPHGKDTTKGQRNVMDAAWAAFQAHAKPFTGDLSKHDETGFCAPVACGNYTLVGTDKATIGGMKVEGDGPYIVRDGMIVRANVWLDETSEDEEIED